MKQDCDECEPQGVSSICWKLSGLISLALGHIFFPPWKLMKIHVVVLMPAGSCRILQIVSTLPSSFIRCPQIRGHRRALVNLYWRLMCLPKWVCQEKWNKLIFFPMLPCNQDIPMHILRRLHFGGIFYISINLCMCYPFITTAIFCLSV